MLKELHIKNVVLIKDIKIIFNDGFSVFTGETGAGKSILLDSLSMALGERANFSMIGSYQDNADIIAIFSLEDHPVKSILKENFINVENELIIRRIIGKDGKSKAIINDVPVSVNFLRNIGSMLLDIHGQFDNQKLLNSSRHRDILDAFLEDKNILKEVASSYKDYKGCKALFESKKQEIEELIKEKEYIEYSLAELEEIAPKKFEEKELLEKKLIASSAKRIEEGAEILGKYLVSSNISSSINKSLKQLENLSKLLPNNISLSQIEESLEKAYTDLEDSIITFNDFQNSLYRESYDIKDIETRLMDIRTIAKKHRVQPDALEELMVSFKNKLSSLTFFEEELENLENDLIQKEELFVEKSKVLSEKRFLTSEKLVAKINQELEYLKLSMASFKVDIQLGEDSEFGKDKVVFKVKTNKGGEFGDLNKVASGGEMARFMLALKIVLAEVDIITTMILDEIDIGVGGEVAIAIGYRLLYLSQKIQLIVVTHSHQVASKGTHHYKVIKEVRGEEVETKLVYLNHMQRVEEIARMISGDEITELAMATAENILSKK